MVTNYKQVKEDVLKQYESFLCLVKTAYDNGITVKAKVLNSLAELEKNIRNDQFCLMVVGEAKSGKSTFINAYLGKEILPMDVKQCTSAIVEIRYGNSFKLTATYADDRQEIIEDEADIKRFLLDNASLDDEYRDIPVPTINIEILMKKKGDLPHDHEIFDLMRGITSENIYKLSSDDYERKVRKYISEKTPCWMDIVKKIVITYPFDDEDLKGIEIVDTPGVNAEGKVGEITNSYINRANAVMFLKPLIGAALEATSFKKFLDSASADRNRDAMFLILTRAANETPENISRIRDEAFRQFPSINEHQIIHLDSKVELFYNRIKDMSEEKLDEFMTPLIDEEKLDSFLETPWYKSKFKREEYLKRLKELSNFAVIDESLNQFAHKAHYMAFQQFLDKMIQELESIQGHFGETIENFRKKAKDPLSLEAELANKKDELEALRLKINTTTSKIASQYTDSGGKIEKKANEVASDYENKISSINESSDNSMEELKKISFRAIEQFQKYKKQLEKEIIAKCDQELVLASGKINIPYKTLRPNFTADDFEKIKKDQEEKSYEKEYTSGGCFKKAQERSVFSQSKYFKLVRDDIKIRLQEIKSDFIVILCDFVTDLIKEYRNELIDNTKDVQDAYDKVLNDKAETEDLQKKIAALEETYRKFAPIIEDAELLKRGVDKHV
ncbi:MAG: dynamin family protein [Lachnospiraceae bacterium]|nr:dynamin family protein [Lachnospiraceae bacterium]